MMYRRSIAILALILVLVSAGVTNAQEVTEAAPPAAQVMPPDGQPPAQPPDGAPLPPDGQPPDGQPPRRPQTPPDGQPPRRPQPQYVQPLTTTTTTATAVYPSQVLILRHIEQTIAEALGLTRSDVNTLRLSETFDQLVASYGGDISAVRTQAMTDLIAWVSEGMSDGTITRARGELLISGVYGIVYNAFTGAFNVSGTTVTGLLD